MKKDSIQITEQRHKFEDLMVKAEVNNLYAVHSDINGVGYIYDDDYLAVATSKGHIKINTDNAFVIANEILGILEDVRFLKRAEVVKGAANK